MSFMRTLALFCFALLAVEGLSAQVITGTILGSVTDSSGATIPNATVTVRNINTNIETKAATSRAGEYTIPLLQPGKYDVTIDRDGFKTFRETGLSLSVDSRVRVDVKLVVGTKEVINISADEVQLQTDSSNLNQSVSSQVIDDLPNVGRSPLRYAGL